MPDQLVEFTANQILAAADLNTNSDLIEEALLDLGPYIITGLVPSAGTGLAVDVTAGHAVIGARVTKASGFSISGLAASSVNHLYLNRDGTTAHNTTGIQPAETVKLGTATTDGSGVTSVDTTPASGRQAKVDLTTVVAASNANNFTAQQTFSLNDASGSAVSRPLILRHSNSGGVGAAGIGAGIEFQIETATEGLMEAAGQIDTRASSVTAGAVTGAIDFKVPAAGVMATRLTVENAAVILGSGMTLNLAGGALAAGPATFSGNIKGSNNALNYGQLAFSFPSDADYTLPAADSANKYLIINAGVITAPRNLILPLSAGGEYCIVNNNAQAITVKGSSGTGPTIATLRTAWVRCTGVNYFRTTDDATH